ncbi:MAG: DUF1800 domain-containing protein [Thiolinea sp.]
MPRDKAIEYVINPPPSNPRPAPYLTPWNRLEPMREAGARTRNDAWMMAQQEGQRLQEWWIDQMLRSRTPIVERMTLFWHNYFTSSIQKTLQPSLLHKQNMMLRQHAFGSFRHLLRAIARDPAMLVYLDGYRNVKDAPNENFARELLELFTIGHGQYTQNDVKAAARAFTGWSVHPQSGKFQVNVDQQDKTRKLFLRRAGEFDGDDIIEILLQHPRTAERVVEKFWKNFVSSANPPRDVVVRWAHQFRAGDYDIRNLLRVVLSSEEFWSLRNRGALMKSPVDVLIGTVRMLPYPRENLKEMVNLCRLLGQKLFDPPTVKGWEGGDHWISTQTLLVRASYLAKISRGNLNERVNTGLRFPARNEQEMLEWLLAAAPMNNLPETPGKRRLAHALLRDPAFQVT